jgi:hypothetical protein
MSLSPVSRLGRFLRNLLDQLMMIFDLSTLDDSVETRLRRLRFIYYNDADVTIKYRRVRDVLRGHVSEAYHDFYQRMLSAERATFRAGKSLHAGARADDLLTQMQALADKIARLIEQVEHADKIAALYPAGSTDANLVAASRQWLLDRIEEALEVHGGVPARVMSFNTVATGRGVDKLSERIARLTNRLDDIADSYADIDDYSADNLSRFMQDDTE